MGTFVIHCDVLGQQLRHELERLRAHKTSDSTYLVHLPTNNPHAIRDHLAQYHENSDCLMVARFVGRPAYTGADEDTETWVAVNAD